MPLIPGICTQCGATLSVDKKNDSMICPYCNTQFIVEQAIQNFNNTYNITNNITAENIFMNEKQQDFVVIGGTLTKYLGESINVTIPAGVVAIGCQDGAQEIENYAFMRRMVETVTLSDSVLEIGRDAFRDCKRLKEITLSPNLARIHEHAFENVDLDEIRVTDNIEPGDIFNLPTAKRYYLSQIGASKYGHKIFDMLIYSNRPGVIYIDDKKLSYEDCAKKFPNSQWFMDQKEEAERRANAQKKVCPNCGTMLPNTAGFCGNCGTSLIKPLSQPQKNNMNEEPSSAVAMRYYEQIDALMAACYNKNTLEFDWDLYHRENDAFIYCPYQVIVEYLLDQLRYVGQQQIRGLNTYLLNCPRQDLYTILQKKEKNVIRNLECMCGGGDRLYCPEYVIRYRKNLYHILYHGIPCTKQVIKYIVQDCEKSMFHSRY